MRIVVLDGHTLNPGDLSWDFLSKYGQLSVYDRTLTEAQTIERIGNAEIILSNKTVISESVLAACPSVKLICMLSTGYNVVDCQAAAKRNIPVCNVPGYGTYAVAQHTIALLLEVCNQVGIHNQSVHEGDWTSCPDYCYRKTEQMELDGLTLGIIGYGAIGQAVAKIAAAMGMKIITHSRSMHNDVCNVTLDELLEQSDVISLHCPLFPETYHIINSEAISKMKDRAILINTSRGPLVDESALADALNRGKLYAAAVDVVETEPIPASSPLLSAPNCIITPHIAWYPITARKRILGATERTIQAFLANKPLRSVNL